MVTGQLQLMRRGIVYGNMGIPVPRFRRRNDTAKIKPVNGLRVEIFRALCGKHYPSIDRLDSRNEDICSKALQMFVNEEMPIDSDSLFMLDCD